MSKGIETLDDLRAAIAAHREEGKRLIRHLKRIEEEYSDWEDRTVQIEAAIAQAELDTGLTKEEIAQPKEYDALQEAFG